MVRAFNHQISMQKSRSFHFRKMFEIPGKHIQGLFDKDHDEAGEPDKVYSKSFESRHTSDQPMEVQQIGYTLSNEIPRIPIKPPSGISTLLLNSRLCMDFKLKLNQSDDTKLMK